MPERRDTSTFDLGQLDPSTTPGVPDPGGSAPAAPRSDVRGRYRIRGLIGGARGMVYEVFDPVLGRVVALKEATDPERGGAALRAEAEATAGLEHPSIVAVYDAGEGPDGAPWYTMRRVAGITLREAIMRRTAAERLALLPHLVDVCQAVAYAHAHGVLHRDLKPDNVLIGEFGETFVVDWGLSRVPTDRVSGTPGYLAPEQAAGIAGRVGERTDVWGLGAILYAVLTGRPPNGEGDVGKAFEAVLRGPPPPPRSITPGVPPELDAIATRALAFDPADRYPSAAAMAADLTAYMAGGRVGAYTYTLGAHLRRIVARNRAIAAVGSVATVLVIVSAGIATWRVVEERDRAVAAERARTLEVATVLTQEAGDALTIGEPRRAVAAAERSLGIREDVATRGLLVAAESAWIPGAPDVTPTGARGCSALAFGPAGQLAAACEEVLWVDDGAPRALLTGDHAFASLAWVGATLVAADRRGVVWTWAGGSPAVLGEGGRPLFVAEGPAGDVVVVTRDEGAERWSLDGARSPLWGPDGPFGRPALAPPLGGSGGAGGWYALVDGAGLHLRDAATGAELRTVPAADVDGQFVAASPDGRWVASGGHLSGGSHRVYLWSLADGTVAALPEHGGAVSGVAFSPDGRWLAARCAGEGIRVWDVASGAFLGLLATEGGKTGGVAFSLPDPRGDAWIATTEAGNVLRWRLDPAPHAARLRASAGAVEAILPGDGGLVTLDQDGRVLRWDEQGLASAVAGVGEGARALVPGPEGWGSLVLGDAGVSGVMGEDGAVRALLEAPSLYSGAWVVLPTGEPAVVVADGASLRTWSPATLRELGPACTFPGSVHDLVARGDVAVASGPSGLVALHPLDCSPVATASTDGAAGPPAVSADGRLVAAAHRPGLVGLWAWPDLAPVATLEVGVRVPDRVAWSTDGRLLAVSGRDGDVEVWDVVSRTALARWAAHDRSIRALAFDARATRLYTAGADGTVGLWSLARLRGVDPAPGGAR